MLLSIWGSVFDRFWIPKSINIQFSYSTGSQNSLLCWPLNCQDLSSTKHLDVLRRFTTSLSSPLCSTWIGNVIRLSFLPPPLASSVYICNPEAPGVICVRCQVHGQEQGNNQDQEGGDQTAERASDAPPTATGEVWLVHWYPIIQPRSAELARQPQSFFTQTAPFHLLPFPLYCSVCLPPSLLRLCFSLRYLSYGSGPKRFPLADVLQYAMEFASSKPVCTSPVEDIDTSAPPGGTTGQQLPPPRRVLQKKKAWSVCQICTKKVKMNELKIRWCKKQMGQNMIKG